MKPKNQQNTETHTQRQRESIVRISLKSKEHAGNKECKRVKDSRTLQRERDRERDREKTVERESGRNSISAVHNANRKRHKWDERWKIGQRWTRTMMVAVVVVDGTHINGVREDRVGLDLALSPAVLVKRIPHSVPGEGGRLETDEVGSNRWGCIAIGVGAVKEGMRPQYRDNRAAIWHVYDQRRSGVVYEIILDNLWTWLHS